MRKKSIYALCLTVLLVIIDQVIKIAVKTHMTLGEQIEIMPWFKIEFIENNGMAWGMELGSKLFLSIFRIVVTCLLIWYIHLQIKKNARLGYITMLSLICAGAAGNIFDSLVYGQVFSESTPFVVSHLVPWGEGYNVAPLAGRVVDMFYFPLFHATWPDWMPFCGGESFTFFSAVFNFADACITVGVFALLLFFRDEIGDGSEQKKKETAATDETAEAAEPKE